MLINFIEDQAERNARQQEENTQLKIDILLAQIQPHFIFNSLTAIRHLCKTDPQTAEQAMGDLALYIRHNMDSLSVDYPIPFEKELEHTRAFLTIQSLRFGDALRVVCGLDCIDFVIPTLTLQPLVENAVFYGVRRSASGAGTATIRSRHLGERVEVSACDDGPGFTRDSLPDDKDRSHTGIRNVRERLRLVSGGALRIESEVGKGTAATIVLPCDRWYGGRGRVLSS